MSQSQENLWTDRKADRTRDRQTLFFRTLPGKAGRPTTFLQQVTGGNTSNLVLKRILGFFLKIPPLKKKAKKKTYTKEKTSNQKLN